MRWGLLAVLAVATALPALAGARVQRQPPILFVRALGVYYKLELIGAGGRVRTFADTAQRRYPAISPDGAYLAYSRREHGNWELYVVRVRGGTPLRLTHRSGFDGYATWSPDGKTIAFAHGVNERFTVETVPVTGGRPTAVGPTDRWTTRPAWSPDGARIALEVIGGGYRDLAVMNADGSDLRLLTKNGSSGHPAWSPDGGSIVYERTIDGKTSIWRMRPDGTGLQRLTRGAYDTDPVVSPNGTVVFVRKRGGVSTLWGVRLEGGRATAVPGDERALLDPTVSPGGIAYATAGGVTGAVFSIRADGTGERRLTTNRLPVSYAVWLPDHRSFLAAGRLGRRIRIFEFHLGRQTGHALRDSGADEVPGAVSADGRNLLLYRFAGGHWRVYLAERDGSSLRPVERGDTVRVTGSFADLAPDGRSVVLATTRGVSVVRADGRGLRRMAWSLPGDLEPSWSPDGARIAFVRDQDGIAQIFVANVHGRTATPLTNFTIGGSSEPAWSPDGAAIAFDHRDENGYSQIFVMNADGTYPEQVTDDPDHDSFGPSWG